MAKRESFKDIQMGERKFRVSKFDAQTGSYIAYQLFNTLVPIVLGSGITSGISLNSKVEDIKTLLTTKLPSTLPLIPREDFIKLQRDCLEVCHEIKNIGGNDTPVAVILSDGRFGIDDIEDNVLLVMALTIHALTFNVSGFFKEGALTDLISSFKAS